MTATRSEILKELTRIGTLPDMEIDLGAAALLLAFIEVPKSKLDNYRSHFELQR